MDMRAVNLSNLSQVTPRDDHKGTLERGCRNGVFHEEIEQEASTGEVKLEIQNQNMAQFNTEDKTHDHLLKINNHSPYENHLNITHEK